MKMNKFILLIIMQLYLSNFLVAQNKSELFGSFAGELPTINLNSSDIVSQKFDLALGYAYHKNAELFVYVGNGVLGQRSESESFVCEISNFGIGANFLYPIGSDLKLGIEASGSYGMSDVYDDINYDHWIYQGGIKVQSANSSLGGIDVFAILGVRNRSFFHYSINSLELFYGIGMRFGVKKK